MAIRSRWRRRLRAWSRRSSVGWWTAVVVLGLVTLVAVRSSLAASAGAVARYGPLQEVPVVVEAVDVGQLVPASAVLVEERPAATLPEGERADEWEGRTALVPLVPGEVLVASKLAPDGLRGAAALLPPGARALAVPSGAGGRPPLTVGDHVDVLATLAEGDTVLVAGAAVVLHVDDDADTVTVAVPVANAPGVASAIATGAITLALTRL